MKKRLFSAFTMIITFFSWAMLVWTIFYIPEFVGGFALATCMTTYHWVSFIKKSRYDVERGGQDEK